MGRVVGGKLVTGCHVLVFPNPCNVPFHNVQQLPVGLLSIILLSTFEDDEVHIQCRRSFNLPQEVIA